MKYGLLALLTLLSAPGAADIPNFGELTESGLEGTLNRPLEYGHVPGTARDPSLAMDRLALRYIGVRDQDLPSNSLNFRPDFRITLSVESIRKWSRIILNEAGERSPVREIRYSVSGSRLVVHVLCELSWLAEASGLGNLGLAFGPGEIFKSPEERTASQTSPEGQIVMVTAGLTFIGRMRSQASQDPGVVYMDPPNPEIRVLHGEDLTTYGHILGQRNQLEAQMENADRTAFRRLSSEVMELDAQIEHFEGSGSPVTASAQLIQAVLAELNARKAFGRFITVDYQEQTVNIRNVDREIFQYVQVPLIFNFAGIVNYNGKPALSLAGMHRRGR